MTLKFNRVLEVVEVYMCVHNCIKRSAVVHELSCAKAFLLYLTIVKNPKIRSCDLDF